MSNVVYEALYCDCIHESVYGTVSLHRTKEGAEAALRDLLSKEAMSQMKWVDEITDIFAHQGWFIRETEIQD